MKRLLIFSILLGSLLYFNPLMAQMNADSLRNALTERLTQQLEIIAENSDETFDFTDLTETYFFLYENPVNINNTAEIEQLLEIYLINTFQLEQLKTYLENFGPMLSKFELAAVDGFDEAT
ncbi:MAG TPA: hypothetical protein PLC47_02695, partial [Bacteroidales bacterium]|nr:hypothetical protein [Bacteroidales bacterium]